jgi:hypothetical protein
MLNSHPTRNLYSRFLSRFWLIVAPVCLVDWLSLVSFPNFAFGIVSVVGIYAGSFVTTLFVDEEGVCECLRIIGPFCVIHCSWPHYL